MISCNDFTITLFTLWYNDVWPCHSGLFVQNIAHVVTKIVPSHRTLSYGLISAFWWLLALLHQSWHFGFTVTMCFGLQMSLSFPKTLLRWEGELLSKIDAFLSKVMRGLFFTTCQAYVRDLRFFTAALFNCRKGRGCTDALRTISQQIRPVISFSLCLKSSVWLQSGWS